MTTWRRTVIPFVDRQLIRPWLRATVATLNAFEHHHGPRCRGGYTMLLGVMLLIATPYPGLALKDAPAPWLRDLCAGSGGGGMTLEVLYRINAGGPMIASIDAGPNWLPDEGFHSGGARVVTGRTVLGIDDSVPPSTPIALTVRVNLTLNRRLR